MIEIFCPSTHKKKPQHRNRICLIDSSIEPHQAVRQTLNSAMLPPIPHTHINNPLDADKCSKTRMDADDKEHAYTSSSSGAFVHSCRMNNDLSFVSSAVKNVWRVNEPPDPFVFAFSWSCITIEWIDKHTHTTCVEHFAPAANHKAGRNFDWIVSVNHSTAIKQAYVRYSITCS